ncbi:MAG: FMN-binding negative transcriptional regulator [Pseudomonadota bacterium]
MHSNPAFRKPDRTRNLAFAAERGFGLLTLAGPDGPLASHIPFILSDTGAVAEMHLTRSNPILRCDGAAALLAVVGPDGYVSPDWYGAPEQVPTWNYVAVHLRGRVEVLPVEALRPHLERLSARFEEALDKCPWTMGKMTEESIARMMRMIVPVALHIEDVAGTWKLNQNKEDGARRGAATAIPASVGAEREALGQLMLEPPL